VVAASAGPYANQLQTDKHASSSSFNFLQAGCSSLAQPTVSKHWIYWSIFCYFCC